MHPKAEPCRDLQRVHEERAFYEPRLSCCNNEICQSVDPGLREQSRVSWLFAVNFNFCGEDLKEKALSAIIIKTDTDWS